MRVQAGKPPLENFPDRPVRMARHAFHQQESGEHKEKIHCDIKAVIISKVHDRYADGKAESPKLDPAVFGGATHLSSLHSL